MGYNPITIDSAAQERINELEAQLAEKEFQLAHLEDYLERYQGKVRYRWRRKEQESRLVRHQLQRVLQDRECEV